MWEGGRERERDKEEGGERKSARAREGGREREEMRPVVEINLQRPCHQWHRP